MRVVVLMMFKNEGELLLSWARYHEYLFGRENLIIFDNGSDDPLTVNAIDILVSEGFTINQDRSAPEDFVSKGDIFSTYIQRFDLEDSADFYFPLDCDEFIACQQADFPLFDKESILASLQPYRDYPGTLMIRGAWDNVPSNEGLFMESTGQRKSFFARRACVSLDHGFHCGLGRLSERQKTDIVYIHFHYKPFGTMQEHARQKLLPFTNDFTKEGLEKYVEEGGPCFHAVSHLFYPNEAEYLSIFRASNQLKILGLDAAFAKAAAAVPFTSNEQLPRPPAA